MKKAIKKFVDLPKTKKIQLIIASFLTLIIVISLPTLAWFSNRRQVATVAKINSPATLYINAGKAEDIIQLKLSDIDVGDGTEGDSEKFVFCVEGEDVTNYRLQISRTTNINFTYTLYKAHTDPNAFAKDENHAEYTAVNGSKVYYVKAQNLTSENGIYINADGPTVSGRTIGSTGYEVKSYGTNDKRQRFAEPLYWQTENSINAKADDNGTSYDEYEDIYGEENDKKFLNFYILEVTWTAGSVSNDKETDIIYITAEVG